MSIDWSMIRYRGDAADVEELFSTYRVENYLQTAEHNRRDLDQGLREQLLKHGVRLTERLSPRIYRLYGKIKERLGLVSSEEIFCVPGPQVNAYAFLDIQESATHALIGVSSAALELLDDAELQSVLGHELGHFLFGNNRLNMLLADDKEKGSVTVLPPLGESLFLRWRKKAEISADRVGLLACGDFEKAARALLKVTFGLSEKNLNLDIEALLRQLDEVKGKPEMVEEEFSSHPLLPIRLKAMELFSRSEKAKNTGFLPKGELISGDSLEDGVDELMSLTRRYPAKRLHQAMMKTVALGGALLLSEDGEVSNEEVKILVQILHDSFTDEPEGEICTNREDLSHRLPEVVNVVNELGDHSDKIFILSRLADIALADGALMNQERSVLLEIARMLEVPEKTAYSIMVGAAQSVGFRTDVKLNRIAEKLRRSLQVGFRPPV